MLIDDFRVAAEKANMSGKDEDYMNVFMSIVAMHEDAKVTEPINLLYCYPVRAVIGMTGDELKKAVERSSIELAKEAVNKLIHGGYEAHKATVYG
jgi:hypothetical protein